MTLERRVAKIEESLSPTQLVLRWLAEAHAYGDVPDYVTSLLAQEPPVAPLDRLAREAERSARTGMRGKKPELVEAAVRSALRETAFRFELVMRINVTVHDLLEVHRSRQAWRGPEGVRHRNCVVAAKGDGRQQLTRASTDSLVTG